VSAGSVLPFPAATLKSTTIAAVERRVEIVSATALQDSEALHVEIKVRAVDGPATAYQRVYEFPRERYELTAMISAANPAAWDALANRVEVKALVGHQMLICAVTAADGSDSWITCRPTRDRDPVDDTELKSRLEDSPRTGQPRAVTSNIEMILHFAQTLRGTYTFDVLRKRVVVTSGPLAGVDQDDLGIAAASWLGETWKLHAQSTRSIGELLFYCARRYALIPSCNISTASRGTARSGSISGFRRISTSRIRRTRAPSARSG
jgi:hypothetical protein